MTTSDADGNFVFKALPAGEYEMKVLKPGFATYLAPQVVLDPGRDLAMTAKLNIGSTNETVYVQAEGSAKSAAAAQALEAEAKSKATRIRIGGNVEAAKVITKVQPIYPESAKDARSEERRVGKECRAGWARKIERERRKEDRGY